MATLSDPNTDLGGLGSLVDGRIEPAHDTFEVQDPSTGALLAHCPRASAAQLDAAFAAARASQPGWAADEDTRREVLLLVAAVLDRHAEPLARLVSRETGKLLRASRMELTGAAEHARYYAEAPIPHDVLKDDPEQRVELLREPVGVVAAITPWNAPVLMLVNKIAAALLVGDTVVAKPSPFSPFSSLLLARLLADVVPAGVVNVLTGDDDLGAAMTAHPETDMIAFTGSVAAGRAIAAAAAPTLKRLLLELGGNDAAIVLPDVEVATVAPLHYRGAFGLSGQICAAIKRLYVHTDVLGELQSALVSLAEAAVLGDPFDPDSTMGPLATRPQYDRVRELVDDALAHGGIALTGGAPLDRPGNFYPPTLVTGIGPGVRLVDEEQFGPALPILPFTDPREGRRAEHRVPPPPRPAGLLDAAAGARRRAALHQLRPLRPARQAVPAHPGGPLRAPHLTHVRRKAHR